MFMKKILFHLYYVYHLSSTYYNYALIGYRCLGGREL